MIIFHLFSNDCEVENLKVGLDFNEILKYLKEEKSI